MTKRSPLFVLLLVLAFTGAAFAQTVNVTFWVNTATVPDTLLATSVIQVRGDTAPLTWDGATGVTLTNAGGDYWTGTFAFPANDTITYKFFTNASSASGDQEHKGWEQDLDPGGNRTLITATSDIVLPLQYVNGSPNRQLPDWSPFPVDADNHQILVRVNMQGKEDFNALTQKVGIRGSNTTDWTPTGDLAWDKTFFLTKEQPHGNGGSRNYNADHFYSGILKIPVATYPAGQEIAFKFVICDINATPSDGPLTWENDPNRFSHVGYGMKDTTLSWDWFNRARPAPFSGADTVTVDFRVDLTNAIQLRGFRTGDTITVQTGWAGSARDEASVSPVKTILTKEGFTNFYVGSQKLICKYNAPVYYQYYLTINATDIRETYYHFDYKGTDNTLAERRSFIPTGPALGVNDVVNSKTDPNRMPLFRNTQVLQRTVLVTYTCDLRPAYFQTLAGDTLFDIQGTDHIYDPATVYPSGLWMNGPATDAWTTWGQTLRDAAYKQMWDDGTHGDAVAGDHIYSVQFTYGPDSTGSKRFVGQEFKFGIKGGDNEGGKGGFGNNHVENIDDSQDAVTIASAFGSINPKYYDAWDYNQGIAVGVDRIDPMPVVYRLDQNYPNPFNPSTSITYGIPKSGWVTLKVFNMLGQELTTLVSGPADPGMYKVVFNAQGFTSGVYMYQLSVGDYKEVRKMTLTK